MVYNGRRHAALERMPGSPPNRPLTLAEDETGRPSDAKTCACSGVKAAVLPVLSSAGGHPSPNARTPRITGAFGYSGTGTRTPISRTRTGRHCQLDYPGQRFEAKNSQSGRPLGGVRLRPRRSRSEGEGWA